ncbi:phasin family protein [Advenella kashmirensis WT001]|uniref:Phasin family protein n=1 Tax=Advenella kashmirensis (strain DSM 17095 / LMG 22695 / WT001) TaxID=1036672 RepID=I3UGH9_ADVKW|nr:phasin family protein [Advenella kashmirensis]AFK64117.1 phasin family protein [Advenella kashmirensis WT001]
MAKSTKDDANQSAGNPFAELSKMYEQFQVPGLDLAAIADARRKDVDALVQANKAVYDGMQALAAKQAEMFRQAMADIQRSWHRGHQPCCANRTGAQGLRKSIG